ncbi:TonB-dependent receptor [Pseudoalteromonas xiamenensis]|uniref:TonB-dependent receptor domain-containing protein n=1 Tax=Pseudoalteromonas xiamenensis TaxID=882626 RepID=UPI0027E547B5|nr:TonB-dependent receptor [Pseudoalteromonas xiamenensis]WMN58374.1 TonB-dependent receptor [Pseudoalteromonas xiamenensis]
MYKLSLLGVAIAASSSLYSTSSLANNVERITVTANKLEQKVADVAASVIVIERADIEKSGVNDVAALLSQQAGFQINRNGGLGQNTGLSLRGSNTRHTLVLIDGVRVGSATLGYKSIANIALSSIERIEVVKGSRAAVYGSDALAGVINIITRQTTATEITVGVGSDSYHVAELAAGTQKGGWDLNLNASFEKTDGFDVMQTLQFDNDGYHNVNVGLAASYQDEGLGQVSAKIQHNQGEVDYDSAWGGINATDYRSEFKNDLLSLGWNKRIDNVSLALDISRASDESDDISEGFVSTFDTTRTTKEAKVTWFALDSVTALAGFTHNKEDVSGSSTIYDLNSRSTSAWFMGATYARNAIQAEGFVRRESDDQFGSEVTYSIGAGYDIRKNLTLHVSQSTGFKAPTFNDLYFPNSGNAALEPEKSRHQELGIKGFTQNVSFETAIFKTVFDNKIAWAPNAQGKWQPANINEARHQGIEVSVTHTLLGLDSSWNYTYLDAKDEQTNSELTYVSKNTLNWRVAEQFDALEVATEVQYRSDRLGKYTPLPSYTLFNLVANYTFTDEVSLIARIENVFDRDYNAVDAGVADSSVFYYNTAERRFYLNLHAKF